MQNLYMRHIELEKKNKAVLNILWYSVILMIGVEILDYVVYQFVDYTFVIENYFIRYIVTPAFFHILIAGSCTLIYLFFNKKNTVMTGVVMIIGLTLFIQEIITIHYGVSVIYMSYAFPIFLSALYNSKKLTGSIALLCVVMYVPLYVFYLPMKPGYTYKHDYMDFTATLVFLAGSFIASIIVMKAFNDLIEKIIHADRERISLKHELSLDAFTKLYNKVTFDSLLQDFFQRYQLGGSAFSVLLIDIDDFKNVNDTHGHDFGDRVILTLSGILKESIRATDYAFRCGGDEFAVLLETNRANAVQIAEKIRDRFNNAFLTENQKVHFSVSIGISEAYESCMDYYQLFTNADTALYEAKNSGKNKVKACVRKKE